MKKYQFYWIKNYFTTGCEIIEANSEEEASELAFNSIGDYENSMQHYPDDDEILDIFEYKG